MLSNKFIIKNNFENTDNFNKYIKISDYIYNNYDKFIQNEQIKKYVENSSDLINKYRIIWNDDNINNNNNMNIDDNRIISNIIALNLFILNNYI